MLKLYSNIKKLRKQLNMSQQELAEAVGYEGKSMISQVENGKVDLPASMISKFADVLQVTELDLMGLNDNVETEPGTAYVIHPKEDNSDLIDEARELYQKYENLSPEKQAAFLNYLEFLQSDT